MPQNLGFESVCMLSKSMIFECSQNLRFVTVKISDFDTANTKFFACLQNEVLQPQTWNVCML